LTADLSALGLAALEYAARGWKVFPLLPGTKDPLISKRQGGRGWWDGTTDADKIRRWWTATPDANIGLSLATSGLVCVDADTYDPACGWASFISGRDLPETLVQRSARGGTHYIFTAPDGADYPGHLCPRVDIKHKGYIVLEPSTFEGSAYRFETDDDPAPAPEWLAEKPAAPERGPAPEIRLPEDPRIRAYCDNAIRAELATLRDAAPGTRNATLNAAAFSLGQIVQAGYADEGEIHAALTDAALEIGLTPEETAKTIASGLAAGKDTPRTFAWEDEPPFDAAAARAMADAIFEAYERRDKAAAEAIIAEAMAARQLAPPDAGQWDAMPSFGLATRQKATRRGPCMTEAELRAILPPDPPPFPITSFLSDMPGLLGLTADYLDRASTTATDAGGIAVAIPLLGAVMGKSWASPTDLRTNIYTVAIGESGSGKTSLVSPAKELMFTARAMEYIGNDRFKSGSGLIKMLAKNRPMISFLDEFGHMLRALSSPGTGIHAREILTELTALYSAANTVFTGAAYADGHGEPITSPHLCLFGMATPEQFWDAFGSGNLEDGSVARYIVMPIGESYPKEPDKSGGTEVSDGINAIVAHVESMARTSITPPCARVPTTEEAHRAYTSLVAMMDAAARASSEAGIRGAPAILKRVAENAAKIALVSAVGRDHLAPQISAHDFAIGHAVARWSAVTMVANIASRIADNQTERDVNDMERAIRAAGAEGIPKWKVFDSLRRIKPRDKADILAGLQEAGRVVQMKEATATKPTLKLYHVDHITQSV
jgi:hypothetical protein